MYLPPYKHWVLGFCVGVSYNQALASKYSTVFFLQAWDDLIEKRVTAFEKSLAGIDGGNGSRLQHKIIILPFL